MIAPSRQLLLRIYAVSLAQLFAVAGAIALVGWLAFKPSARGGFVNEAQYAVANLAQRRDDPAALSAEVARIHEHAGARMSVYGPNQKLLASNQTPPFEPLTGSDLRTLLARGRLTLRGRPPRVVLALDSARPARGYVIYRPGGPPEPPVNPLLWGLTIALIAAAVASVLLARSFVKPLQELTGAAHQLGHGDLSARVRSKRNDEFGQLAAAFDDMADRLTMVLRSQQELLANVSHELRTPLARIRVALDLAAEGDAATAQEALSEIAADLAELERLVADVLQTARLDLAAGRAGGALPAGRSKPLDASELVDSAVQRFRAAHPSRQLVVLRSGPLPAIVGDPILLRRALDNLLDNARAYSDDEASIELVAGCEEERLSLSVIDHGIGIAPADLPKITTPFFRTDPSRARRTGGLGLGLSLARRIVEWHGGELRIESELNRGTTVRMLLPTLPAAHASLEAADLGVRDP